MANHLSIFAKLNMERNYSIIENNISAVLCLKYNYQSIGIKLINMYAHKNAQLFLNYNLEILQQILKYILYIQHG